jgi:hypothetical protein
MKYSTRNSTKVPSDTLEKSGHCLSFIAPPISKLDGMNHYSCNQHHIDSQYENRPDEVMHIKSPSLTSYSLALPHNSGVDNKFRHG